MQVGFLGWKDPLVKEMAAHSSILAWRIPETEESGGLQSMGSQRVRHNLGAEQHQQYILPQLKKKKACIVESHLSESEVAEELTHGMASSSLIWPPFAMLFLS